jgi:hypothetical protein
VKVATGGVPTSVTLNPPEGFPTLTVLVVGGVVDESTSVYVYGCVPPGIVGAVTEGFDEVAIPQETDIGMLTAYEVPGVNPVKVPTGGVPASVTLIPPEGYPGATVIVVGGVVDESTSV